MQCSCEFAAECFGMVRVWEAAPWMCCAGGTEQCQRAMRHLVTDAKKCLRGIFCALALCTGLNHCINALNGSVVAEGHLGTSKASQ